jgi:hypothetical protein
MLLIGLGGSGGKTLRFLKRDLRRWLAQPSRVNPDQYWTGGIPDGWQLLGVTAATSSTDGAPGSTVERGGV